MNVHICTLTQARLLTQHASVPVGIISLFLKITAARMLACSDRVPTPATLSVFLFNFFFHCSTFESEDLMLSSVADLRLIIMHVRIGRSLPFQLVSEHRWGPAGARKGAGTRRYGNAHRSNIHAQFMPTFCSSASAPLWPLCSLCTALQTNTRFRDLLQVNPLIQTNP